MKSLPLYNSTYQNLVGDFARHLERLGYTPTTCKNAPAAVWELFHRLELQGIPDLQAITPGDIKAHYHYLLERPNQQRAGSLSGSTVQMHLYAFRTFFRYQERLGALASNPVSSLVFPRHTSPERTIITPEQIKQLYSACNSLRDRALLGIFYGCGLRRSEGEMLNITDVQFRNQVLYVRRGKGKKRRAVPMSGQVLRDLQDYFKHERSRYLRQPEEDQPAFLLNNYGQRMLGPDCGLKVKALMRKAGLPAHCSLHHLRHAIATHLLESGLIVEQVRDFLGHTCLDTTQIYTRISHRYLASQTQ